MYSRPQRNTLYANELFHDGAHTRAAIHYVAASDGWFMRSRHLPEDVPDSDGYPGSSPKEVGRAVEDLLYGILCFRISNAPRRAKTHCERGCLFITDILDSGEFSMEVDSADPRRGLAQEMLGDLRNLADIGESDDHYSESKRIYDDLENKLQCSTEPEFQSLNQPLVELGNTIEFDGTVDTFRKPRFSLAERVEYKRQFYQEIVTEYIEQMS